MFCGIKNVGREFPKHILEQNIKGRKSPTQQGENRE